MKMLVRKEQKLQPNEKDINQLHEMITVMLKRIALIETYWFFQELKITLTNEKMQLFSYKVDQHFENLLMILLLKIKNKEEEENIDFTIEKTR